MADLVTHVLPNDGDKKEPLPAIRATLQEVLQLALPNMATCLMGLVTELINTIFLGHAGDDDILAAVGLGNMMQNCFGLHVGMGIASALDTLVSQAYGAQQHKLSCHYFQRCRILVTLMLIWMVPLLAFSEPLLLFIRQDSAVALYAGQYNRTTVWGLFAFFQFSASQRFLMNRGQALVPAVISIVTSILHVGWCSIFVWHLGWGNAGAGLANVVTWWLQFLFISLYLVFYARQEGLEVRAVLWLQGPAFREWGAFLELAVPGTIQICSESWFWEVCAVVVGYLGSLSLAAHVATMNWVAVSFTPVLGIGFSAATLVGNALGAGLPRKAALTAVLCVCADLVVWLALAILMVLGSEHIAKMYSWEEKVVALIRKLLYIFAVLGFWDSAQNVMGSTLRGIGKQHLAAIGYAVFYWAIMLPLGCILAFPLHLGVYGVWLAMAIGTMCPTIAFGYYLWRADYEALSRDAVERLEEDTGFAGKAWS